MPHVFNILRSRLNKHARYTQIRNEINALSAREAFDIGIVPGDGARIASEYVYGR